MKLTHLHEAIKRRKYRLNRDGWIVFDSQYDRFVMQNSMREITDHVEKAGIFSKKEAENTRENMTHESEELSHDDRVNAEDIVANPERHHAHNVRWARSVLASAASGDRWQVRKVHVTYEF